MIPVSIVTGFLGSGKTTLIARLLRHHAFARTAVIVNEWGEIGLDHEIIAHSEDMVVALPSGCLCCAIRSDLIATLLDLERRRAAGDIPPYERVVIETSGLADPAPILQSLLSDPDLLRTHAIEAVVTLVDALHGEAALTRHVEARRQALLADRLVLTKTDIAGMAEPLRARLAALNPGAPVLVAIKGGAAPDRLFAWADVQGVAARIAALPASSGNPILPGRHSDSVETFVLLRERPLPGLALALLLQALAEHCGPRLLRVKGLIEVAEMPGRPALIHGVQHVFATPEWLPRWPSDDHRSRLVFISQGVPRHFPSRLLDAIEAEVIEEMGFEAG